MEKATKPSVPRATSLGVVAVACLFLWTITIRIGWGNERNEVSETLRKMTIDQKLGQLLMVGFHGTSLSAPMQKILLEIPVGGFILFRHNLYQGKESTRALTEQIQGLQKKRPPHVPSLIAVDLEGGIIKRFPKGLLDFPSARYMGDSYEPALVEAECIKAAQLLASLGINMNLAPVLEPCSTVMTTRSFSCDIQRVSEIGVRFTQGFQSQGVVATGKHFPGNAAVDQHRALGRIHLSPEDFKANRLTAYEAAIKAGIGAIMTSHVYLSAVDDSAPATLSEKVVTGLLKNELGFSGIVIADDLLCSSEKGVVLAPLGSVPQNAVRAIQAGVDMVMLSDANYTRSVHGGIKKALLAGEISSQRLDDAVRRILAVKRKFGILLTS